MQTLRKMRFIPEDEDNPSKQTDNLYVETLSEPFIFIAEETSLPFGKAFHIREWR